MASPLFGLERRLANSLLTLDDSRFQ